MAYIKGLLVKNPFNRVVVPIGNYNKELIYPSYHEVIGTFLKRRLKELTRAVEIRRVREGPLHFDERWLDWWQVKIHHQFSCKIVQVEPSIFIQLTLLQSKEW